jgi:hypothetical protein
MKKRSCAPRNLFTAAHQHRAGLARPPSSGPSDHGRHRLSDPSRWNSPALGLGDKLLFDQTARPRAARFAGRIVPFGVGYRSCVRWRIGATAGRRLPDQVVVALFHSSKRARKRFTPPRQSFPAARRSASRTNFSFAARVSSCCRPVPRVGRPADQRSAEPAPPSDPAVRPNHRRLGPRRL